MLVAKFPTILKIFNKMPTFKKEPFISLFCYYREYLYKNIKYITKAIV